MKEALRMHAAVGLPLWRTVNEGGVELSGEYLPAGSVVGINAWVSHFNKDVWGTDVDEYRPERWIEPEAEGGERLKTMEQYY
ncbi:cytochrome P450, partial [Escherichia coli]|uniref:cytochrome P450 n=1 Tax=Escherichia coli TaxID=562 RepID=UPI0034D9529C